MKSLCIVSIVIFLSWSLVEVHSQTFPYVSFMNQTLDNHSYVDLSLVGRPDRLEGGHSVECHTDLTSCCRRDDGVHRGDWYYPNGVRLPFSQSTGIFEAREFQRVDLRSNFKGLLSSHSGIYRCDIAVNNDNDTSVRDISVYVGLYANGEGTSFTLIYMLISYWCI